MKITRPNFLIYGFLLLLLFTVLTFLVQKNVFVHLDYSFTVKLQSLMGNRLITFFSLFSIIGRVEIVSAILLIVLFINNKLNKFLTLLLFIATGLFEELGKYFVGQKGPPIKFLKTDLSLHLPSDLIPRGFFAYPSGHSARTAFVSGILILVIWESDKLSRGTKYFLIFCVALFDFLMFISRIYLGEHWLSDVVGGAILGLSLAIFASNFNYRKSSF